MESQSKTIMSGIENNDNNSNNNNVGVKQRREVRAVDLVIRLLALALTLTSAIILGVDKQTKVVPLQISPNLPPLNVPFHARSRDLSAFVYSVVASSIACAYAAASLLLLLLMKRGGNTGTLGLMIMVADMVVAALLFSGNGAAAAIGLMGFKGNTKVRWSKVCNVFERFCHQVAASLALSLIGALAFLLLVVLASVHLHRKAK